MPILILFAYFGLEIYVLLAVWDRFGFVNTVFALLASAILGAGIIRNQGRYVLTKMQATMARGLTPTDDVLHGILVFLGGLLLIVPGFISDVLGLLLVLPGSRHLLAVFFKRQLAKQMKSGRFRVFSFGTGGGAGPRAPSPGHPADEEWMRDVSPKVIDVTPTSVKSEEIED